MNYTRKSLYILIVFYQIACHGDIFSVSSCAASVMAQLFMSE
ncbi:hypothetical protein HMPREF0971_00076 [Segatella oris F0302]|uniref:Uncharacterized protein n=1 Tax=Segatella oris F0302 TaxID=649760 RepID=D1QMR8_9BACT|nr:hypothetical protein HMPREF0971_00076 [Segatella oris F0302]